MSWISVGIGAIGLINSMSGGGGNSGGGGGGGTNMYTPSGLGYADQNWQYNQAANQGQLDQYAGLYPNAGAAGWGGGGGYQPPQGMSNWQMGMPQSKMTTQQVSPGQGTPVPGNPGWFTGGGLTWQGDPSGPTGGWAGSGFNAPPGFGGTSGGSTQQQPYGGQSGLAATVDPAFAQSYQQSQNINYNPYLQASQQAGQQYGNLANQAGQVGQGMYGEAQNAFGQQGNLQNTGNQFYGSQQGLGQQSQGIGYGQLAQSQGLAQALPGAGQQVYNTAFDPQQQLYQKMQQQVQDQSNAANSMYGLGSSGQGAAIANQNMNNFNIDWQNQQLGRQSQGLQALTGANQAASGILGQGYGGAQTGVNSAGNLGSQGASGLTQLSNSGAGYGALGNASLQAGLGAYGQQPGFTQQSAQTPLNAWQYAAAQPGINASTYAQQVQGGMSPYMAQQNQAIPYMNYGAGAQDSLANNQLAQNKLQAQQQSGAANTLGQGLNNVDWSQVGKWFGGNNNSSPSYSDWYPS